MRRKVEVPLFCEELRLTPSVRLAVAVATGGMAALGMWAATQPGALFVWVSGLGLTGATLGLFACWRLFRFETTVGRYGVRAGLWEFSWSFPRLAVEQVTIRSARRWRRLFAPWEVQVTLFDRGKTRVLLLPSKSPEELVALLDQSR